MGRLFPVQQIKGNTGTLDIPSGNPHLICFFQVDFDLAVLRFGLDKMSAELDKLRQAQDKLMDKCDFVQMSNEDLPPANRLFGHGVMGFQQRTNLDKFGLDNRTNCRYYALKEADFVQEIREFQTNRSRKILSKQESS